MAETFELWDQHPPSVRPAPDRSLRAFRRKRSVCRNNVAFWLHRACDKPYYYFSLFPILCGPRNIRRPDVAVVRGPINGRGWLLEHPVLTVDVLPPGATEAALAHRLRDYATTSTIQHCLMVEVDRPRVLVYGRGTAAPMEICGLESTVEFPGFSILPPLPLALVYKDMRVQ